MPPTNTHRHNYQAALDSWKATERRLAGELQKKRCGRSFHQLRALAVQLGRMEAAAEHSLPYENTRIAARRASEISMAKTTLGNYEKKFSQKCVKAI